MLVTHLLTSVLSPWAVLKLPLLHPVQPLPLDEVLEGAGQAEAGGGSGPAPLAVRPPVAVVEGLRAAGLEEQREDKFVIWGLIMGGFWGAIQC